MWHSRKMKNLVAALFTPPISGALGTDDVRSSRRYTFRLCLQATAFAAIGSIPYALLLFR